VRFFTFLSPKFVLLPRNTTREVSIFPYFLGSFTPSELRLFFRLCPCRLEFSLAYGNFCPAQPPKTTTKPPPPPPPDWKFDENQTPVLPPARGPKWTVPLHRIKFEPRSLCLYLGPPESLPPLLFLLEPTFSWRRGGTVFLHAGLSRPPFLLGADRVFFYGLGTQFRF